MAWREVAGDRSVTSPLAVHGVSDSGRLSEDPDHSDIDPIRLERL
jgi:hypothetical protein